MPFSRALLAKREPTAEEALQLLPFAFKFSLRSLSTVDAEQRVF
tara:strand:- start:102 stop:233 length:132 start_codon:yes stop_codon:yes gene_type:complete